MKQLLENQGSCRILRKSDGFIKLLKRIWQGDNGQIIQMMKKPVVLELIGEFRNLRILDLGCGDATFGKESLTEGCQSYLGI